MERATEYPPHISVGSVFGVASDATRREVLVAVEVAVYHSAADRIVVHIATDPGRPPVCGDSWWLANDEVATLADWLSTGATTSERQSTSHIGSLDRLTDAWKNWLSAAAAPGVVELRFDHQTLRDERRDNRLLFQPDEARRLAELLIETIRIADLVPPLIREISGNAQDSN